MSLSDVGLNLHLFRKYFGFLKAKVDKVFDDLDGKGSTSIE